MHVLEIDKPTPFDVMLREEFYEDIELLVDQMLLEEDLLGDPRAQLEVRLVAHARSQQLRLRLAGMLEELGKTGIGEDDEDVGEFIRQSLILVEAGVLN